MLLVAWWISPTGKSASMLPALASYSQEVAAAPVRGVTSWRRACRRDAARLSAQPLRMLECAIERMSRFVVLVLAELRGLRGLCQKGFAFVGVHGPETLCGGHRLVERIRMESQPVIKTLVGKFMA
jgi:hypothetical protein